MSRIDTKHLIISGIAASVVLNAADWVTNNYVLADQWRHVAQTHNVDMFLMNGTGALATFIGIDCVFGFLLAWVYVAIRPRLGPGPATATLGAFTVWGAANAQMATFGGWFIGWDLFIRTAALSLVAMIIAGLAAGWVYKEADAE